jgi:hypothetical protein
MQLFDPITHLEDIMTRETAHGTKGSSIVRALVAAVLVASMFGLSALTASAQEVPSGVDIGDFAVPTPLEVCQEQFPDGIVDTAPIVEEALAGADVPPEIADQITSTFSFTVTCEDVFGGGGM